MPNEANNDIINNLKQEFQDGPIQLTWAYNPVWLTWAYKISTWWRLSNEANINLNNNLKQEVQDAPIWLTWPHTIEVATEANMKALDKRWTFFHSPTEMFVKKVC